MPANWTFAETIESLDLRFPWLAVEPDTDEWIDVEPTSGADVINDLQEWYDGLVNAQRDAQRGSIRLTLLAFQLAVAIGIGSGVLSIVAWAQAALGGVL